MNIDEKFIIYDIFNKFEDNKRFEPGEIVRIELNKNFSKIYLIGDKYETVDVYESFPIIYENDNEDDIIFNYFDVVDTVIKNVLSIKHYTDRNEFLQILSLKSN